MSTGIATGKTVKVPYEKGGFEVLNLPLGIEFKKPSSYGTNQIQQIMAVQEEIRFVLKAENNDSTNDQPAAQTSNLIPNQNSQLPVANNYAECVHSTLSAIVGNELASRACTKLYHLMRKVWKWKAWYFRRINV